MATASTLLLLLFMLVLEANTLPTSTTDETPQESKEQQSLSNHMTTTIPPRIDLVVLNLVKKFQGNAKKLEGIGKSLDLLKKSMGKSLDLLKNSTGKSLDGVGKRLKGIDAREKEMVKREEKEAELIKKIMNTVEHFKDINGTKIFDLVKQFNEFRSETRQEIDHVQNSTKYEIDNASKNLEENIGNVAKALEEEIDAIRNPYVYYPPGTVDNMVLRRYIVKRATYQGFKQPSRWNNRWTYNSIPFDQCLSICELRRHWGYHNIAFSYYYPSSTCYCYWGPSHIYNNNEYLYYKFD